MATGSVQTLRPATVYMFPFAAHTDPGAEAVTQFGQTGQGLVPSWMDDHSALAWPTLPAPSSIACKYTPARTMQGHGTCVHHQASPRSTQTSSI